MESVLTCAFIGKWWPRKLDLSLLFKHYN